MRQTATLVMIVAAACGAAPGDQITIGNVPYFGIRIVGLSGCQIVYQLSGREIQKRLNEVTLINIPGQNDFNGAEELMKAGKAAEAVAAYDKAAKRTGTPGWHKQLIHHRRLRALGALGLIDRAVADWLTIVEENGASGASLELCPTRVGKKGSPANAKAIKLLEGRLGRADDEDLQARIKPLLRNLYQAEGLDDKAAALNGGKPTTGPGDEQPTGPPPDVTVSTGSLSAHLTDVARRIQAGQYLEAAEIVRKRLDTYGERELPAALLLRGKALLLAHSTGASPQRQTLIEAGLCLMRVAACVDPASPEVPEAAFLAAEVCKRLGNGVAAANTYRMIAADFRIRSPQWAQKAQEALGGGE
jgi:tetratricopeptide (TPR) repeat protein